MMYKYKFVSNLKIDIIVYLHKKRIYPSKKLKTYLYLQKYLHFLHDGGRIFIF